jgi:hypothetical protein
MGRLIEMMIEDAYPILVSRRGQDVLFLIITVLFERR